MSRKASKKTGPGRPKKGKDAVTSTFSVAVTAAEWKQLKRRGSAWARQMLVACLGAKK